MTSPVRIIFPLCEYTNDADSDGMHAYKLDRINAAIEHFLSAYTER
jgi:hypothetical protein